MKLPLAVILGFVPLVSRGVMLWQSGGAAALQHLPSSLIPYNFATRRVDMSQLGTGLYPIIAGALVHKVVGGMFGINRMLAASRIPWLRV